MVVTDVTADSLAATIVAYGSFFFLSSVVDAAMADVATEMTDVDVTIVAYGSVFFLSSAADAATDVDANTIIDRDEVFKTSSLFTYLHIFPQFFIYIYNAAS